MGTSAFQKPVGILRKLTELVNIVIVIVSQDIFSLKNYEVKYLKTEAVIQKVQI